ncbi:MAG: serine/threonine-protein kinase [Phycisphaerales bacterium]|nr:serine/threonine-protein kinase [Phycisphaerales bacterium]
MAQDQPKNRASSHSGDLGQDPSEPLSLADSDTGKPHAPQPPSPVPTPRPVIASPEGATTTGGFETLMGKLVISSGLATPEEVEQCNEVLKTRTDQIGARTLADLLVERSYVTDHQLSRLRDDFEAKKSGQRIPGYRIQRKLGSGAMATVFLAHQLSLDRPVAIKVLPKKFSDNVKFIERFYKEGRAAAKLNHPNIVGAYDVGHAGEHHYFVMEYVDGMTVYEEFASKKRLDEATTIRYIKQVALALQHAHDQGFIHRDIKPKNIMLSSNGTVKLADLGLARALTDLETAKAEAGRAYGTPYYISPEQIRGDLNLTPATDIYGLGATTFHMLTGQVPFQGKNPSAVMHRHLKDDLVPPDHLNPAISPGMAQIIEMMMEKQPGNRYQTAEDLLTDLELVGNGQPPHFARHALDLASAGKAESQVAPGPPTAPQINTSTGSSLSNLTIGFIIVTVALVLSLLVNAFLFLSSP